MLVQRLFSFKISISLHFHLLFFKFLHLLLPRSIFIEIAQNSAKTAQYSAKIGQNRPKQGLFTHIWGYFLLFLAILGA